MRKLSPWRSAGIARYTPSAKVAMFCFLCERKLIFQFFYSFWNSPPGLDMWRGGKVHGRVEDEPGGFLLRIHFFFIWELQVADTCTMILKKFLADPMIPKPKSCLFTSWYSQPYTGGSYTAIGSGGTQVLLLIFHSCPLWCFLLIYVRQSSSSSSSLWPGRCWDDRGAFVLAGQAEATGCQFCRRALSSFLLQVGTFPLVLRVEVDLMITVDVVGPVDVFFGKYCWHWFLYSALDMGLT